MNVTPMTSTPPIQGAIYNHAIAAGFFPLFLGMLPPPMIKYGFPADFFRVLLISQGITFIVLLILCVTYTSPSGSLEEIDGPQREVHEMHENAGKLICFEISLWLFSWTWLDLRCMFSSLYRRVIVDVSIVLPLAIFVFFYSFQWIPQIVISRFPCPRIIKDVERDCSRRLGVAGLNVQLPLLVQMVRLSFFAPALAISIESGSRTSIES